VTALDLDWGAFITVKDGQLVETQVFFGGHETP
jgi:hypothetical protein